MEKRVRVQVILVLVAVKAWLCRTMILCLSMAVDGKCMDRGPSRAGAGIVQKHSRKGQSHQTQALR